MNEIPKPEYLPANTDSIPVASHGRASSQNAPQDYDAAAASSLYEQPINILIVDDEPKNLTVLETVLDDPHYRLVRATSADQALLALLAEEFALLILDIQMPGMSGFELAQMIKERKKTAHVPIIFLTAYYNQDQDMLEGYSTGAVDYLHKPVNASILRSKVAVFADLHRKSRALLAEVAERRLAQEQLRELNETLEQRVNERTEALLMTSAALNESLERYHSLFNGSLDAIISLGTDGRFDAANPAMLRLTGRTLEELKTIHLLDLCLPDQREAAQNVIQTFCHQAMTLDTIIITATGEHRDLFVSGAPLMVGGKLVGISCIARDVTERNRAEAEVKQALALAEQASLAKSDFLSRMSHELRTPLNAVLGFAQLLTISSPPPTPTQTESISQITKAGWYLLELINEILDLAAVESGKLLLSCEPVSLTEVMLECEAIIEPQAQKKGVRVNFIPFNDTGLAHADRTRLKQTLLNLLSNAIKYNREHGTVDVICTSTPERIRISIKDSGVGLSAEKMAQLFQAFNRLGQENSGEQGTGIGLVVTKQLVELMGGAIGVESTVGVGSEFWIELNRYITPPIDVTPPLIENTASTEPVLPDQEIKDQEIKNQEMESRGNAALQTLLYVEDNPANLMLVEQIIARHPDIRLLTAVNGNSGIEIARVSQPDVILMDINLPGISGIEALKILRADPATAHIPVVALSANAMLRDVEKGLEEGFFRYLTKPINVNEFMSALNDALKFSEMELVNTNESAA